MWTIVTSLRIDQIYGSKGRSEFAFRNGQFWHKNLGRKNVRTEPAICGGSLVFLLGVSRRDYKSFSCRRGGGLGLTSVWVETSF